MRAGRMNGGDMAQRFSGGWRRLGVIVVAALLAVGFAGTLLAQPSPPSAAPTPPPARTSTLQPPPTATPIAPGATGTQPQPPPSGPPAPVGASPFPLPSPVLTPGASA